MAAFTKKDAIKLSSLCKMNDAILKKMKQLKSDRECNLSETRKLDHEHFIIQCQIKTLKKEQSLSLTKDLRFPRIKRPPEVMKTIRGLYKRTTVSSISRDFVSVLFHTEGGWVFEVYGAYFLPDKTKKRTTAKNYFGRKYYLYPALKKFYCLYREYEDGRCFKSGRIYTVFMRGPSFQGGTFTPSDAEKYGRAYVSNQKWFPKYQTFIKFTGNDPAVTEDLLAYTEKSYCNDPIKAIRLFKQYRLCRHLFSIGEIALAFDSTVLRYLKGDKLNRFKNWWKQSEESPWFYWKPLSWSDIKTNILDGNYSQKDIYISYMKSNENNFDMRTLSYLYNQKVKYASVYTDYLNLLKSNGYQLTYSLLYPKDIKAAHDAMVLHKSQDELEVVRIGRNAKFKNHFTPTVFETFNVKIVPFNSSSDFLDYGSYMRHCYKDMDSYYLSVAEGKTAMFAICDVVSSEPISVVTYNFETKKVVHNLGINNASTADRTKEIAMAYVKRLEQQVSA